ncbi:unnamed protein product [Moneuplotes crassus]|uniref:Major facilitator superfamily (MFS) profile domain-containing protein n=1 Tax=Euplotes crassus TaxID=5936 RepID=A0AAD1X9Q9_EUPCR|nr:unnamed protein product [Moneuplotes crassus]
MDLKHFIALNVAAVLCNACYMLFIPFLSIEFKRYDIREATFGYIIAMYSVSSMISSLFLGKFMIVLGRKRVLVLGILCMSACLAMFSSISYLENSTLVCICCFVFRALQGLGSSMIHTPSYAIISISYGEKKQKYLALFEGMQGIGLALGPAIGGVIYSFCGFGSTFYILAGLLFILCPILYVQIPESFNEEEETLLDPSIERSDQEHPVTEIKAEYWTLIKNRVFSLTAIVTALTFLSFSSYHPELPTRLQELGLSSLEISFFFAIGPTAQTLSSVFLVPVVTSSNHNEGNVGYEPKKIIVLALIACGFGQLCLGPSMFLPDRVEVIIVAMILIGTTAVFLLAFSLSVMTNESENKYPTQKSKANDLSSGVFFFACQCGATIGPIYCSYISEIISFRNECTTVGVSIISFALIYYVVCILFQPKVKDVPNLESQILAKSIKPFKAQVKPKNNI